MKLLSQEEFKEKLLGISKADTKPVEQVDLMTELINNYQEALKVTSDNADYDEVNDSYVNKTNGTVADLQSQVETLSGENSKLNIDYQELQNAYKDRFFNSSGGVKSREAEKEDYVSAVDKLFATREIN